MQTTTPSGWRYTAHWSSAMTGSAAAATPTCAVPTGPGEAPAVLRPPGRPQHGGRAHRRRRGAVRQDAVQRLPEVLLDHREVPSLGVGNRWRIAASPLADWLLTVPVEHPRISAVV